MNFKKYFLPGGLIIAILFSLCFPSPGAAVRSWGVIPYFVMTIFLVNGFQTSFSMGDFNRRLGISFAIMIVLSLLATPFLGMWIAGLLGLPASLALGLMVMSAMPTTLSSGIVISGNAGGSVVWALIYTMGLNLVGIFTIPFILPVTLSSGGDIQVSPWILLYKLLIMVLIPFVIGLLLKRRLKLDSYKKMTGFTPSTCVILVVWASLSSSRDLLLDMPLPMLGFALIGSLLVHAILMAVLYVLSHPLQLRDAEKRSFVFVGSQKTLPVAISVLTSLQVEMGQALVLCIIFHFAQLIADSLLAGKWHKSELHLDYKK